MSQRKAYSPEFKDEAVREVIEKSRSIADVARDLGLHHQTLYNWVKAFRDRRDADGDELTVAERAKIRELESKVRDLEEENRFLKKASAFFARNQH